MAFKRSRVRFPSAPPVFRTDGQFTDREEKSLKTRDAPVLWRYLVVAAVALGCYVQTARYDFAYDDALQIVLNPRIRSFSSVGAAFTEDFWAFIYPHSPSNYFRPLQTIIYMTGYALGGLWPASYHWINIAMHVCASLTVLWLGLLLLSDPTVSVWGALLFAAHPMHTENVAWIAGITDLGCGLFFFLSLGAYIRARQRGSPSTMWLAGSLVAFLNALLFKEMAFTLPVVVILLDYLVPEETTATFSAKLRRWLPFFAVFALYAVLRLKALGAFTHRTVPLPISAGDRFLTTLYFTGRYLQDLIAPFQQNAYHVFRPFSKLAPAEWVFPILLLALGGALIWKLLNTERKLCFLALWVAVTIVPVLNLEGLGQNIYTERYLYIPSLGFCLLVPAVIERFQKQIPYYAGALACTFLVLGLSVLTIGRNPVWKDSKTLYTATLSVSPDAALIHNNLGTVYFGEGDFVGARQEFLSALAAGSRVFVHSVRDRSSSLLGLSSVANAEGKPAEAWQFADEARILMPQRSEPYQILGALLGKQGDYNNAEKMLRRALQLQPSNAAAHHNLANILQLRNDLAAAEREFRLAVELDPKLAAARVSLGMLLVRTHRASEAASLFKEALALDPRNKQARQFLKQLDSEHAPQ